MELIILDGNILANQELAHDYLKEMLHLADYYGKNLDALYDCLTELKDTEIQITVGEQETVYFRRILHVFQDVAEENETIKVNII